MGLEKIRVIGEIRVQIRACFNQEPSWREPSPTPKQQDLVLIHLD